MPRVSRADKAADVSANEARRRKEVALAEKHEIDLAERRGTLIPVELVEREWAKVLATVKAAVEQIPARAAQHVAAAKDKRETRLILARECENALREVHGKLLRVPR